MTTPGYNMGDDDTEEQPTPRLRQVLDEVGNRFRQEGGGTAFAAALNGNSPYKPTPQHTALAMIHPAAPAAFEAAKWAFRGNRTARTQSLYREQNIYGGVQRDLMPTERIAVRHRGLPTQADSERSTERMMLDYEELALPIAGGGGTQGSPAVSAASPLPSYLGEHVNPLGGMHRGESQDPLFRQNTGQGGVNPWGFDPHQRATTGIPMPGK